VQAEVDMMSHVRPMRGDVMDQPTEKYWKSFSFGLLEILPYGKLQLLARMAVQSLFVAQLRLAESFLRNEEAKDFSRSHLSQFLRVRSDSP
jgi:hypothetical protein